MAAEGGEEVRRKVKRAEKEAEGVE
jgi:hypothetical protein